ncbi:MAG: adenosylmethionine--8-amino-7-oxononanoate transaminase [Alphaproteobacteria bacterium]|nr:adenosylmethionine--8-amino-7-oxononanoate transaminase [Alphaproteobacteria bacterium]
MTNSSIWHPFTQHAINPDSVHVDRANGAYLFARKDVQDKSCDDERRIIDAISSWWVVTHGHSHPHIVNCVKEQSEKLAQVIFAGFTHEPAEQLAARLSDLTAKSFGQPFAHAFFSDSGSTSVEVALKMAIGYWTHTGKPRRKIIALEGGYHGDTFGAMSLGARSQYNAIYEPYLFDVTHIPVPEEGREAEALTRLEDFLKANKDDVAAFIFEPLILGAGGMRFYSPQALKSMADLCCTHGVLLIADEIMTGFGRTGTMFACEQADFMPDMMCLSKGLTGGFLPMGLTLCSHDIFMAYHHKSRERMFFHSTSYTGNALSCAAANASLDIWENEPVFERISTIAKSHESAALKLSQHNSVANIRQKGTILAFDIVTEEENKADYLSMLQPRLYQLALERNVLLRPLGNTLYVLPPYCVTQEDLQEIYDTIHDIIRQIPP